MNKIEFVSSLTDVDCLKCRAHNNTYIDQYYSYCYTMALVSKILKCVTKIPKSNDGITLLRLSDLQYTLVLHKTKKRSPVNISQWYGNILKPLIDYINRCRSFFLLIYQTIFSALYYCSSDVFVMSELCCLFKKLCFIETVNHSCIFIW